MFKTVNFIYVLTSHTIDSLFMSLTKQDIVSLPDHVPIEWDNLTIEVKLRVPQFFRFCMGQK
jgi:hypothetical protein